MSLLNEIGRIKSVMGLVNEQDESKNQMNVNLKKVVEILNFLKIYNNKMENSKILYYQVLKVLNLMANHYKEIYQNIL